MKRLFFSVALALAALVGSTAFAQSSQNRVIYTNTTTGSRALLSGVALNAAAGTRTFSLTVAGRTTLSVQINMTRATATTLTMSCKASLDGSATFADIQDQIVTSGLGTLAPHVWSRDVSGGSQNIVIDLSVGTYDAIQCLLGGAGAGGSDLVTVYAIGGARL